MRKIVVLLVVMLAVAGCGRRNIDAPTPTSAVFQPTPTPFLSAADAQVAKQAALATEGEVIFNQLYEQVGFACETCHFVDQETQKIGPGLLDVAIRGETRIEGQSPEEYIRNSIIHPNDYIVEGFTENLMPQTYADVLTVEELDALVAYLMTLQ